VNIEKETSQKPMTCFYYWL